MSYQTDILEACKDYGFVPGKTLFEYAGWRTRGSETFDPKGSVNHHTAGPRTGDLPTLNTLVYGRSDLPGPLCNGALSRSAAIHLIAAGRANHAGTGGWAGLSGNSSVWGLEVEHYGYADETVSDERWDAMYRWHRACMDVSGFSSSFVCQHFEWAPTRKIDFVKDLIPNPGLFRSKVATITPGDDMSAEDSQRITDIHNWVAANSGFADPLDGARVGWNFERFDLNGQSDTAEPPRPRWMRWLLRSYLTLRDDLTTAKIADAVVAKLPPGGDGAGPTLEQIRAVCREESEAAVRRVLGAVDQ